MLIDDIDVAVYGYRPPVSDKHGLRDFDVIQIVQGRERGLVLVKLDCLNG